jgi:hypothetical protein
MPRTQEVQLDFSNLAHLDNGKIDLLLRRHIARIAMDCMDRPGDKSPRKVSLEFSCVPIPDDDGSCESVRVEIEAKSKVPTHRSKPYHMRVTKGGLLFNQDFPEDLDQQPLPYQDK